jgi:hypothetical protein
MSSRGEFVLFQILQRCQAQSRKGMSVFPETFLVGFLSEFILSFKIDRSRPIEDRISSMAMV